ncbi:MAG: restriction endonuclease [Gammaproteobacteria bacterium]|nr:restriction endonuclease [Gammaproteobacteria bacterium]
MNSAQQAVIDKKPPVPLFNGLGRLPSAAPSHLWADYVELRALTGIDKVFSHGFLEDSIGLADDVNIDANSNADVDGEDSGEATNAADEVDTEARLRNKWRDIKVALTSRQSRMGAAWPFEFSHDVLRLRYDNSNSLHQLYLSLLVASSLRYVERKRYQEIADYLEEVGAVVFTALMPTQWTVKVFGANSTNYNGTKSDKLRALAADLRAQVTFEDDEINDGDTGDAGLDVVAWHDFGDSLGQIPIAFAQCGCSPNDIDYKQLEPSPASFNRWMKPHHPAAAYYIAPLDFRKNNGHWVRKPAEVIMIDRSRIVNVISTYNLSIGAPGFVSEALNYALPTGA